MAIVVRVLLSGVPWDKNRADDENWLEEGDIRADALKSLKSENNTLSVYFLKDSSELARMLSAFSAAKEKVQKVDYAVFADDLLNDNKIRFVKSPAQNIPDPEVSEWHYDIVELTATKILQLAKVINEHAEISRASDKDIGKWINMHLSSNHLSTNQLKDTLLTELKNPKYQPE